jgi:formylglycine-generating enzyme
MGASQVGEYGENKWGLCDMHGNVFQWCADYYGPYETLAAKDPFRSIKHAEEYRVLRGGGWANEAKECRAACRMCPEPDFANYNFGIRVAFRPD